MVGTGAWLVGLTWSTAAWLVTVPALFDTFTLKVAPSSASEVDAKV